MSQFNGGRGRLEGDRENNYRPQGRGTMYAPERPGGKRRRQDSDDDIRDSKHHRSTRYHGQDRSADLSGYTFPRRPNEPPSESIGPTRSARNNIDMPVRPEQEYSLEHGTLPLRGPAPPTHKPSDWGTSTEGVYPPAIPPSEFNAALPDTRRLPNGLRADGGTAKAGDFFAGQLVWAAHIVVALNTRADPNRDKNFSQTNVAKVCAKKRLFFVEYAHDRSGLQAFPVGCHGGNGLERVPYYTHDHHIPIRDDKFPELHPNHPSYRPVRGHRHFGQRMKKDSYIDISISYNLNFRERIEHAGFIDAKDTEYVCEKAENLRQHGKKASAEHIKAPRRS